MNQLNLTHDKLAPILSSIAQTYQDIKRYDDAINFYCQEVKIQKQLDNQDQVGHKPTCCIFIFFFEQHVDTSKTVVKISDAGSEELETCWLHHKAQVI